MVRVKPRQRRRHVQQELFRHGGRRRGAGRKPTQGRARSAHKRRPVIKPSHALHVVLRILPAVGSLRRRVMYKAVRDATVTAAQRGRFRIVHVSLQRTHVHMLVEAEHAKALGRGMQGFEIAAARNINTALAVDGKRRRGSVFADRYHVEVIKSPTQARHAISYVLNNWRKHREDQEGLAKTWLVDPFSTGILFPDWVEMADRATMWPLRETYDPMLVFRPQSWVLREGWKKCGTISCHEVPSRRV